MSSGHVNWLMSCLFKQWSQFYPLLKQTQLPAHLMERLLLALPYEFLPDVRRRDMEFMKLWVINNLEKTITLDADTIYHSNVDFHNWQELRKWHEPHHKLLDRIDGYSSCYSNSNVLQDGEVYLINYTVWRDKIKITSSYIYNHKRQPTIRNVLLSGKKQGLHIRRDRNMELVFTYVDNELNGPYSESTIDAQTGERRLIVEGQFRNGQTFDRKVYDIYGNIRKTWSYFSGY